MTRAVDLLQYLLSERGSDLLIKVGSAPAMRRNGRLEMTTLEPMSPDAIEAIAREIMTPEKAEEFDRDGETDLAYSVPGLGRFRVNVYRQRGSVSLAIRRVVPGAPAIEDLGVPRIVADLAEQQEGLVIISGPAGSGRTTTAAAMIDHINGLEPRHIVTIEDPIEVLHADRNAVISQREVGTDTADVVDALRRVARQDADVIFVSSLMDADAIAKALTVAAAGRLVIGVMDTLSVLDTLRWLVDRQPSHAQEHTRHLLARVLRGIVCQRLMDRADGRGRIALVESLTGTMKVRDAISNGADSTLIERLMSEGEYHGMATNDQALLNLYSDELISWESAILRASHPEDFRIAVQQAGLPTMR